MSGLAVLVSGLTCWVSGLVFWLSGLICWISGLVFWSLDLYLGVWTCISGVKHVAQFNVPNLDGGEWLDEVDEAFLRPCKLFHQRFIHFI